MPALIDKYADVSSVAASEWYEETRAKWADAADGFTPQPAPRSNTDIEKLIRANVGGLWTGDDAQVLRNLNAIVDRGVRQGGHDTITYNAGRDPSGPRFARVPAGGVTCAFCVMLASRGWVYASEETAGAFKRYHSDCDCEIVPSWDKGKPYVEGYDPDALYARYLRCRETVEPGFTEWMTAEEKTLRILHEMAKRDRQWLNDGVIPEITEEAGASPLAKERVAAAHLADNGFIVRFRATQAAERKRTSDIYIGSTPWEIKRPTGDGKQTIIHQFEEAAGQSSRLIIDMSGLDPNGRWKPESVEAEASRLIQWHWKDAKGAAMQYDEVLLLGTDGALKRISRTI